MRTRRIAIAAAMIFWFLITIGTISRWGLTFSDSDVSINQETVLNLCFMRTFLPKVAQLTYHAWVCLFFIIFSLLVFRALVAVMMYLLSYCIVEKLMLSVDCHPKRKIYLVFLSIHTPEGIAICIRFSKILDTKKYDQITLNCHRWVRGPYKILPLADFHFP